MEIHKRKKHWLYYLLIVLLSYVYLFDAANIDDIILNDFVVHSDELLDDGTFVSQPLEKYSGFNSQIKKSCDRITTVHQTIYDQDSPSIKQEQYRNAKIVFFPVLTQTPKYFNQTRFHSLYLLNCTLLI
ncbi:MAG: hypothetical protein NT007_13000 [Candidatus Kapabacteria bacterium]|nr:hypothetical protein [Candidatus Kapabacteria bacterium]